jgi:hypothetical protein
MADYHPEPESHTRVIWSGFYIRFGGFAIAEAAFGFASCMSGG